MVVKKFKIENGDVSLRDFLSECHAMEAVRHPNIVMFLGVNLIKCRLSLLPLTTALFWSIVRADHSGPTSRTRTTTSAGRNDVVWPHK